VSERFTGRLLADLREREREREREMYVADSCSNALSDSVYTCIAV
jgi:hypothetical protein